MSLFARNGIDNTSIRAIAADAGVDPALVHHYFGTKTQLFAAAIHIPIDPMTIIGPLREVPVDQIGRVLPSLLLPLWDSEAGQGIHRDPAVDPGRQRRRRRLHAPVFPAGRDHR